MARTVTVTGQGSASAVPDIAMLRVAATRQADTAAEAFAGVAASVTALLTVVGEVVGDAAVATQEIGLHTHHDQRGRPAGFDCRQSLVVRCPSLETASDLLGRLLTALGDRLQVDGITLEVSDSGAAEAAAREAAYADAVSRATALAGLAGATLGEPQAVTEGGPRGGYADMVTPAAAKQMPIAAGERSVAAAVTVTFALV